MLKILLKFFDDRSLLDFAHKSAKEEHEAFMLKDPQNRIITGRKLTVVLNYYEAMETYGRIELLRS
jgi:hypothetical protein